MTPVVIAARIWGHHVLTCGSESRTAALNTVHMSIATTWTPARHWRVWAPIHADTLAAVRPSTCPSSPAPPTRSTSPTRHRSATTSQISPPSGASTRRNFAFLRRVSSIPRCVTGGVSFGSAAAAVNAVFATGHDTSKSRAACTTVRLRSATASPTEVRSPPPTGW